MVALDSGGAADGDLYLDDGSSFAYQRGAFLHRRFRCANNNPPDLRPKGSAGMPDSFPRLQQAEQAAQGRLRRPCGAGTRVASSPAQRTRARGPAAAGWCRAPHTARRWRWRGWWCWDFPAAPRAGRSPIPPRPPPLVAALLACILLLPSGLQHDRWRPLLPQLLRAPAQAAVVGGAPLEAAPDADGHALVVKKPALAIGADWSLQFTAAAATA